MTSYNNIDLTSFPTTRYQGSKRKILPWLYDIFNNLEFDSALDAFGGTASVSYLLKRMHKEVTYNDSLRFNYLIGKALIENNNEMLSDQEIQNLLFKSDAVNYGSTVRDNFQDIYYLDKENEWIDMVVGNINNMGEELNQDIDSKQALAYYALFQSCLIKRPFNLFHRKNLNLRTNDVERSFGNKVTWDKPFDEAFTEFARGASGFVFDNGKICSSTNESVFDINHAAYDLVYLDPPYIREKGSNETSYYYDCYHFLEGLAMYNDWPSKIDMSTKHRKLKQSDIHHYFSSEKVHQSFIILIEKFQESTIVLSYKIGGHPSVEELTAIMKRFKKNVTVHSRHYKYALNRQNGDSRKNQEVVIIGV